MASAGNKMTAQELFSSLIQGGIIQKNAPNETEGDDDVDEEGTVYSLIESLEESQDEAGLQIELTIHENDTENNGNMNDQESDTENNNMKDPDYIPDNDDSAAADSDANEAIDVPDQPNLTPNTEADDGLPARKKRKITTKKRCRTSEEKIARNKEKYKLLPPCKCKFKCEDKITGERRANIFKMYWNLDYTTRGTWMLQMITRKPISRRTVETEDGVFFKNTSRTYSLQNDDEVNVKVCKVFFLHTLGYSSDKVITKLLQKAELGVLSPPPDQRGHHVPKNKTDTEPILKHILSFHPSISHYRREHAPLRRYLPPELTITDMHKDFVERHPEIKVSYETYRKVVEKENISFVKLGEEECEDCVQHDLHMKESHVPGTENCDDCKLWNTHLANAKASRAAYKIDKEFTWPDNVCVLSGDMQKIIMLPRIPGIKTVLFTRRLVLFHETFAPLGTANANNHTISILWNEAVSGRNGEDLASAFIEAMNAARRDCDEFVIWSDNCCAQNKNWILYTALVIFANQPLGPKKITLKYLEKGHTFMSADSFHARVEKGLRQEKKVCDMKDFVKVVQSVGNVTTVNMTHEKFRKFKKEDNQRKGKPLLQTICEVQFKKNSRNMFYKTSFSMDYYIEFDFLKAKVDESNLPPQLDKPRGIPEDKKEEIKKNLLKFMPKNRHPFWNDLQVNNGSNDLAAHLE